MFYRRAIRGWRCSFRRCDSTTDVYVQIPLRSILRDRPLPAQPRLDHSAERQSCNCFLIRIFCQLFELVGLTLHYVVEAEFIVMLEFVDSAMAGAMASRSNQGFRSRLLGTLPFAL